MSFGDDPLRMLRGARFSSQLDFVVDPDTLDAIRELRSSLAIVSPERVQAELVRLLQTDDPVRGIRVLVETGLIEEFLPEVPALRLEVDEHHHHKDVYEHSLTVLRQAIALEKQRHPDAAPDVPLRLAAAPARHRQPATRRLEAGGASPSTTTTSRAAHGAKAPAALRFDAATTTVVTRLVELHLRFFGYAEGAWTDAAVRRYVRDAGDELERLHILTRADVTTRNKRKAQRLHPRTTTSRPASPRSRAGGDRLSIRPELDGNRIQEVLGLTPGREVGEAYRFLLELRLDEGVLGEEEAEKRLREWWAARG